MANLLEQLDQVESTTSLRPSLRRPNPRSAQQKVDLFARLDQDFPDPDPSPGIAGQAARLAIGTAQGLEGFLGGIVDVAGSKAPDLPSLSGFLEDVSGQKVEPGQEGAAATVGQAIGGVAPSFILGATVGIPTTIGIFAVSLFGRALKEADEAELDDVSKFAFAAANAGLAPLEAIPVARTLSFLNKGTGGLVQKLAIGAGSTSIQKLVATVAKTKKGRALLAVLQAAPEEAAQEAFLSQVPENALAKAFGVDPDRELTAGVGRAALLGAIGGGAGAAVISPFTGGISDGGTQDQVTEAGPAAPVQVQPSPAAPEIQAQAGAESRASEGAQEVTTANQVPTGDSTNDFTQPRASRSATVETPAPGQPITSPEGTVITTPRQKDLRDQASRVLGEEVPVPSRFKMTGQDLRDQANKDLIPGRAKQIADELNASSNPDPMNPVTAMGLVIRLEQLDLESTTLVREIETAKKSGDFNRIKELGTNLNRVREEFLPIYNAVDVDGSVVSFALRARRFAIDQDMNIFTLEARAAASKGSPLTTEEREFLNQSVAEMKKISENLASAEERIRQLEAELEFKAGRAGRRAKVKGKKKLDDRIKDINRLLKAGCA